MVEMVEIHWFVSFMIPVVISVGLAGFVVSIWSLAYSNWRWTVIGLLMAFSLIAYLIGHADGRAVVLGTPIKLENLMENKIFSVVEAVGKSHDVNLILIKTASCDDKKEKCARIVAVTLSGLPVPGKSFFLKEINGKITVFPVPNL